jgi:hypothetical protein
MTTSKSEPRGIKQPSTIFLRIVIVLMGLMAIGIECLVLPAIYSSWEDGYPMMAVLRFPVMVLLGATIVPFFVALYQTKKLLDYIDTGMAFTMFSVHALGTIKYSAAIFSILYIVFLPVLYQIAQVQDAPGLVVIGMIMAGAPIVIAVLSSVFQKLLDSAITMKNENDLTV